jgi:hypothetical protein
VISSPFPPPRFHVLYVFVVLRHGLWRIVYFNVAASPGAEWAGQQIAEAFPYDETPRFLMRDRDGIYGDDFTTRVESLGIEEAPNLTSVALAESVLRTGDR